RRARRDVGAQRDGREGRAHTHRRGARLAQEARVARGGGVSVTMIWLAALCLGATMFFSAAEMAFIAANRPRLRHLAEQGSATATAYLEARSEEHTSELQSRGHLVC